MQHNNNYNCNLQLAGVAWLMHEFGNGKLEEKMQKEKKIVNGKMRLFLTLHGAAACGKRTRCACLLTINVHQLLLLLLSMLLSLFLLLWTHHAQTEAKRTTVVHLQLHFMH